MFTEQRTPRNNNQVRSLSLVNRDSVKDLQIPGFEHQTVKFIERSLMTSKPSIFRIIPGYDESGNIYSTLREGYNPELLDKDPASCLSGTFCSVSSIQPFGNQWRDAVLTAYQPGSADDEERINLGKMSVIEKFARVVNFCTDTTKKGRRPMQAHQDWFRWTALKGSLGKVKWRFMFQAIVFQDSGRYFPATNESTGQEEYRNMIALLSLDQQASINTFMEELATPAMRNRPVDVFSNSNLGPVAELNGIWCYLHPEEAYGDTNIKSKLVPRPYPQGSSPDTPPTAFPLEESWVKQVWTPWTKLLKWYSKEEQYHLIAEVFGPDTVNYFFEALGDDFYTAFIPMDIRQKGYGRYAGMLQRPVNVGASFGSSPAVPQITPPTSMSPAVPVSMPKMAASTAPVVAAPVPAAVQHMPKAPVANPVPAVPTVPSTPVQPTVTDQQEDEIGHMPKAPSNLPPAVQDMMKQALSQGVQVQGAPSVIQNLGLPKVPTVNLDDIVPTEED